MDGAEDRGQRERVECLGHGWVSELQTDKVRGGNERFVEMVDFRV